MIVQEDMENDLVKTYSDQNLMIRSLETGYLYDEAIDPKRFNRQYEESDVAIQSMDDIPGRHSRSPEPETTKAKTAKAKTAKPKSKIKSGIRTRSKTKV